MAHVQYQTSVDWDATLTDLGYTSAGLVESAVKITSGAPAATAGKFIAAAQIKNSVTGITYTNEGTTASPVWNAIEAGTLPDGSVTKAKLATGVSATFMAMFLDDSFTTVGGAAAEAITITGVAATDKAIVSLLDNGTNNVSIVSAVCTTNTLTVTFSGDPGNDTVINYVIFRATS
jgi:hypothetical protein